MNPPGERLAVLLRRGGSIKVCGLREPEHAAAAAAAGADLIGFVFAPARRQVSAAMARSCIAAARTAAAGRDVLAIGVFVDASPSDIADIVQDSGIDAVQLHGAEPPELVQSLTVPVIKALRPRPGTTAEWVIAEIDRYRSFPKPPVGFLIDGYSDTAAGGAGAQTDWGLAAAVGATRPVLLGGGLDPGNVGAAIRQARPLGVDVSSGVETDGVKDTPLIEEFIREARSAFLD